MNTPTRAIDRRRYPRFEGHFKVDLLNLGDDPSLPAQEAVIAAEALDVSKRGMRLRAHYNVPVGSHISLIAYFRGRESLCLCQVIWKSDDKEGQMYGLLIERWTYLDEQLEKKLDTLEASGSTDSSFSSVAFFLFHTVFA